MLPERRCGGYHSAISCSACIAHDRVQELIDEHNRLRRRQAELEAQLASFGSQGNTTLCPNCGHMNVVHKDLGCRYCTWRPVGAAGEAQS